MSFSRTNMAILMAAIAAAGCSAGAAKGATVFGPGVNSLQYHNYENIFDSNGNELPASAGAAVGDYVVGVLRIDTITYAGGQYTSTGPGSGAAFTEVTGIFAQKVTAIVPTSSVNATIYFGLPDRTTFQNGADSFSTGLTGNAMFSFFVQTNGANFVDGIPNTPVTMAQSVQSATDGTLLMSLGYTQDNQPTTFSGDTGYFYSNSTPDSSGNPQLNAFAGLNIINNNAGLVVTPSDDPGETLAAESHNGTTVFNVDMWLKSGIALDFQSTGTALESPWNFISSDPAKINIATVVPLPAAAWSGMMLLAAMGGLALRRRRWAKGNA